MLSRLVFLLVLVPLGIVLVVFCVVNRQAVTVSLDPVGTVQQLAFSAPLFVLLLGALILGLLLGGLGTWLTQSHYRRRATHRRREIENLRYEVDSGNERLRRLREERERERAAALPSLPAPGAGTPSTAAGSRLAA